MYEVSQKLHDHVYITIDLGVLDPAYMPSTGTPDQTDLTYREMTDITQTN